MNLLYHIIRCGGYFGIAIGIWAVAAEPTGDLCDTTNRISPIEAARQIDRWKPESLLAGSDTAHFGLSHYSEVHRTAIIPRLGAVVPLERAIDPQIGEIQFNGALGEMKLSKYLYDPRSKVQGVIVIKNGTILYEAYPGMRSLDMHLWMSITKTAASLVVRLLEEEGKIDADLPLDLYLPWLKQSGWEGVKIIDALDMMTGMDILETRLKPDSIYMRTHLAGIGASYLGDIETIREVLRSAKKIRKPGTVFEYGSPVSLLLAELAEAVTDKRWSDLFAEYVWSHLSVEGDMQIGVSPDGLALVDKTSASRLRDLARYGMLYTPSWQKASRKSIISKEYLNRLQHGRSPEAFEAGGHKAYNLKRFAEAPIANGYQWDAVFADGDLWKSGLWGQGLYISPSRDLVVAFFGAAPNDLAGYARAIARSIPPN